MVFVKQVNYFKMNTYTIKDLNTIWTARGYLPLERFVHFFTLRFGYTEREAKSAFEVFSQFPKHIYGNEDMQNKIDKIIPLALQIVDELYKHWDSNNKFQNISYYEKELRKLVYSKNDELKELVLDLHSASDIITYSELIKQEVKQIALLRFCCEVPVKNSDKYFKIFEGDIFDTTDLFYTTKSNMYVAEKNNIFKKLLYTKGKGYLRNGELDFDKGSFNYHCLTLTDWVKIGNVTTDLIKLTDDGVGS